jgi:hypothetical protein
VVSDLAVQRSLEDAFGQLLQQTAFAAQLQARGPGLLDQPSDELSVHAALAGIVRLRHRGSIHGRRLVRHQVLLP